VQQALPLWLLAQPVRKVSQVLLVQQVLHQLSLDQQVHLDQPDLLAQLAQSVQSAHLQLSLDQLEQPDQVLQDRPVLPDLPVHAVRLSLILQHLLVHQCLVTRGSTPKTVRYLFTTMATGLRLEHQSLVEQLAQQARKETLEQMVQ
jgi:hypothetical protein